MEYKWAFIGNPGAKKHVFAGKLSKLLQVPHISIASLVRQDLHPRSSLYKQIANAVNNGKLVPENVIFGLLSERLEAGYYRGECGFILNGIPRSVRQAVPDFFVKGRESGIFPHCNECCCTSNYDSATLDMPTSPVKAKSATPSKGIIRVYLEQQECTPGVIQMKLETSIENRMWAARMTKHVMEMNKHLQSRLLDLMQNRLFLSADSTTPRKRKKPMIESSRIQEEEEKSQLPS